MSGVCCKAAGSGVLGALFSNAVDGPMTLRLIMAGLLSAVFFFQPLSTSFLHIIFIAISFALGIAVAVFYWCFLQNVRARFAQNFDEEDILTYNMNHDINDTEEHHIQRDNVCFSKKNLFLFSSVTCQGCDSLFFLQYEFIFPTVELLFLGIFVLLSPHVMKEKSITKNFTTSIDNNVAVTDEVIWVNIVWRVWYLHIGFVFSFAIPFIAIFIVALIHFVMLLAHYRRISNLAIYLSLLWFVAPLIWTLILALCGVGRPRFCLRCRENMWFKRGKKGVEERGRQSLQCEVPLSTEGDLPLLLRGGRGLRSRGQTLTDWQRSYLSHLRSDCDFAALPTSIYSQCLSTDFCAKEICELASHSFMAAFNQSEGFSVVENSQRPLLFLGSAGDVVLGASVGFATLVGMSVAEIKGQNFATLLEKLEVENIVMVIEAIRSARCFFFSLSGRVINGCNCVSDAGSSLDGNTGAFGRRAFTKTNAHDSFLWEASQAEGVTVYADSFGYSFAEENTEFLQCVSDSSVRRILLRGRCLQSSSPPPSSPLPLVENEVMSVGCADSKNSDSIAQLSVSGRPCFFAVTLDVWVEHRPGAAGGVVVLSQPHLHHALEQVPLPFFLVNPLTGRVLYWSPTAELRTSMPAYNMVGWKVHTEPFSGIRGLPTNTHYGVEHGAEGEERTEKSKKARLGLPLWATLHMPSTFLPAFTVTFQPLAGDPVKRECDALRSGISGFTWPPRHFSRYRTSDCCQSCTATSYANVNANEDWCCKKKEDDVVMYATPHVTEFLPDSILTGVYGRCGACKENQGWQFASLAEGFGGIFWPFSSASTPLLFLIHGEVQANSSHSGVVDSSEKEMPNFVHVVDGVLKQLQPFVDYFSDDKTKKMMSTLALEEGDVFRSILVRWRHFKGFMDEFEKEVTSMENPYVSGTAASSGTNKEGMEKNFGNIVEEDNSDNSNNNIIIITDNIIDNSVNDTDADDDKNLATKCGLLVGEESRVMAIGADCNTLGPTEISVLSHASAHSKDSKPLRLSDGCKEEWDGEDCGVPFVHREKNRATDDGLSLGIRDNSGGTSAVCRTRSDVTSNNKSKKVFTPRLISPPTLDEAENKETKHEVVVLDSGMVLQERIALDDVSVENGKQEHFQFQQGVGQSHYYNEPVSSQQTQAAVFLPHSSVGESFATPSVGGVPTPTPSICFADEKPQIWAMLRSSDDSTISSCFISVPFCEDFCFGRSSKCHAVASDALVSGIQFTIVREECSEFQYSQLFSQRCPDVSFFGREHFYTSPFHNSEQLAPTARRWVVKLHDKSVNGTYVNVKKVGKGNSCVLCDGYFITFRLRNSSFFSGFQFLLTDERGVPLREGASRVCGELSGVKCGPHDNNTTINNNSNNNNNGTVVSGNGGSLRGGTGTRSRRSGASGGRHHHHHSNTIEWKIGEEMLGKGGSANVYLGINLINGNLIAVKRVPLPPVGFGDDACSRAVLKQYRSLQEEINVLSKAVHPNIVQYYGSSQNQKYFNILLEFVSGGSLRHLLDNFGKLSPEIICSYLRQTLEGLRYLHNNNIVHSDLKAANILVTGRGRVKISDFGTAKALNKQRGRSFSCATVTEQNNGSNTTTCRVAGTLLWMAPELVRPTDDSGPTRASDIWSVGCVLIEMLTSSTPWNEYEFENEEQIINLLRNTTEGPKVPECAELPELSVIANSCLALIPEKRPSCEELLQMVEIAEENLRLAGKMSSSSHNLFIDQESTKLAAEGGVAKVVEQLGGDTTDSKIEGASTYEVKLQYCDPHKKA